MRRKGTVAALALATTSIVIALLWFYPGSRYKFYTDVEVSDCWNIAKEKTQESSEINFNSITEHQAIGLQHVVITFDQEEASSADTKRVDPRGYAHCIYSIYDIEQEGSTSVEAISVVINGQKIDL